MKKCILLMAAALFTGSAFAQHYEWTVAQLPTEVMTKATAQAAGYKTFWTGEDSIAKYIGIPAQDIINNENVVVSLACPYNYASVGNSKYSGANYTYKIIMGMNNSTRDGIDPTLFNNGVLLPDSNKYVRKAATDEVDNATLIYDAMLKVVVPADMNYGRLTIKTNRGGNLGVLYAVDKTKGQQVLLSATRCPDSAVNTHIASFNVQPGHEYYVFSSEKGSVELYAVEYDILSSDNYEVLATEENSTSLWTAAQLPTEVMTKATAQAAGYKTFWTGADSLAKYIGIPAQDLISTDSIKISLGTPYSYASVGNGKYSGADYAYKLIMGMNNSTRDGIDPTLFSNGVLIPDSNKYVRKAATDEVDNATLIYDAMLTISVPSTGTYGRVIINTNRGGNLGVLYVVDKTKSQQILLSASRCPDDHIKTHAAVFNVQPGHDYVVFTSEKGSVELYRIGYCETTSEKYAAFNATTAINTVHATEAKTDNKMFNLVGQRVNKAKGLVIMNGKKIIIK